MWSQWCEWGGPGSLKSSDRSVSSSPNFHKERIELIWPFFLLMFRLQNLKVAKRALISALKCLFLMNNSSFRLLLFSTASGNHPTHTRIHSAPALPWGNGVITLIVITLIKWVGQSGTSVDELCPNFAHHFFSKNYCVNEPGVFAHFYSDIQLYSEARKSLPLHGKCGI